MITKRRQSKFTVVFHLHIRFGQSYTSASPGQFAPCVTLPSMPESPALDRKIKRSALSREARRLADEMENLYIQLEQVGAIATVRQYMTTHSEGSQRLDLLQTAKALRCYAGVLSLIASASAQRESVKHEGR